MTIRRGPLALVEINSGMKNELRTPPAWVVPLGDYLTWLRISDQPETTLYQRSYQLRRFAIDSGVDPFAATIDDLSRYLGSTKRDWAPNTRRGHKAGLRGFYTWAHSTGRMATNPSALLPRAPMVKGKARPIPKHVLQLAYVGQPARETLMMKLGEKMGMRCSEIARAHTRDLHPTLVGWSLHVHGKGRRDRNVPMPPEVLALVRALPEGFFFPGAVDGHLSASYVSKLLSRALPGAYTGHQLRHTAATRVLKAAKGNLRVAQDFLGHSSSDTTDIYTHVDDSELHEAVMLAAAA